MGLLFYFVTNPGSGTVKRSAGPTFLSHSINIDLTSAGYQIRPFTVKMGKYYY